MRFLENDLILLLGFLLLFGLGLTFFRNDTEGHSLLTSDPFDTEFKEEQKKREDAAKALAAADAEPIDTIGVVFEPGYYTSEVDLSTISEEQILNYMRPLFLTKSASAIVAFLNHIPVASVFRTVKAVVQSTKLHLPARVKLRIIFAGAQRQQEREDKFQFFNLVVKNESLSTGTKPLIVKAVEAGYAHLVPDILAWAQRDLKTNIVEEALLHAAHYDDEDPEALRELREAGVPMGRSVASDLLWEMVDSCANGYSIPFLVNELHADVNHFKNGATVLAHAVQMNKTKMVQLLLEFGAKPKHKATLSAAEKSALELAREQKNESMISLMMSYT